MIAMITGKLVEKEPNRIVVDVGGVGYELTIPLSTYYDMGEPGVGLSLRVHTHVREDALQLYGFRTEQEKRLFLHLTSVTGIGPKLAITILSGMITEDLIRAITGSDLARLVAIPGVGKKTAERMLVELKDKVQSLASDHQPTGSGAAPGSAVSLSDDLVSALVNLGYAKNIAERAAATAIADNPDAGFSMTLKLALRNLAR